jgi:hypothetical protein
MAFYRQKQSKRLRDRFGPEYGKAVDDFGSQMKGESELKARDLRFEYLYFTFFAPFEVFRFIVFCKSL